MLGEEIVAALTALASAESPLEVERHRRAAIRVVGTDVDGLHALVEALADRSKQVWELERLATEDPLTGLANRRAFRQALVRELARRRRTRGPAVILLDLDGLKEINDRFGHAAGDEAIRLAAQACVASVRAGDLPARLGGDELALLLPDTDIDGAWVVADRVRGALEASTVCGVPLKVSLGVAVAGPDGDDEGSVLARADARLYEDKRDRKSGLRLVA
ncbi:MAG TPA: GGDEF domain-containing protein [Sandaracinaceae bacterium LLY-WYZ-13_1]|nr:GGDEF domain-containing protein [Sandaracinaceae bacterium LLY-WYZ-13_1]